jgi:hypothetical protein
LHVNSSPRDRGCLALAHGTDPKPNSPN